MKGRCPVCTSYITIGARDAEPYNGLLIAKCFKCLVWFRVPIGEFTPYPMDLIPNASDRNIAFALQMYEETRRTVTRDASLTNDAEQNR